MAECPSSRQRRRFSKRDTYRQCDCHSRSSSDDYCVSTLCRQRRGTTQYAICDIACTVFIVWCRCTCSVVVPKPCCVTHGGHYKVNTGAKSYPRSHLSVALTSQKSHHCFHRRPIYAPYIMTR